MSRKHTDIQAGIASLPCALPDILIGMRIAIGFGWTTLVAAEMVAANVGLGQMVLNASNFLRTDIVIMGQPNFRARREGPGAVSLRLQQMADEVRS